MRFSGSGLLMIFAIGWMQTAWASDPRVIALGSTALVMEEDTTALTLFNLGNPAAAAFLPQENRMDWLVGVTSVKRTAEFVNETAGNTLDPFGNNIPPQTTRYRQTTKLQGSLDDWGRTGYGGYLVWLDPQVIMQFLPTATALSQGTPGSDSAYSLVSGEATARIAWKLLPNAAIGAGAAANAERRSGWNAPDLQTFDLGTTAASFVSEKERDVRSWALEAGAVWRQEAFLDNSDFLDLGLRAFGQRTQTLARYEAGNIFLGSFPSFPTYQTTDMAWPLEMQIAGVYDYKSALDISLTLGYQSEKVFRSLSSDALPGQGEHLIAQTSNPDFEMQFRVRLPMVRDDDLRFGVVFDNRAVDHPYPNGRLLQYEENGLYSEDPIDTSSSSIGIGAAFVPDAGSLIALEYRVGSSKSVQESSVLSDSGSTRFGFGGQYSPLKGLALRLGFSHRQVKFQSDEDSKTALAVLNQITETNALSLGATIEDGSFALDLTGVAERVTHSPAGWTMLDKPLALTTVSLDAEQRLSALLALRWKF